MAGLTWKSTLFSPSFQSPFNSSISHLQHKQNSRRVTSITLELEQASQGLGVKHAGLWYIPLKTPADIHQTLLCTHPALTFKLYLHHGCAVYTHLQIPHVCGWSSCVISNWAELCCNVGGHIMDEENIPLKLLALPAPMTIGIPYISEIKYLERNKVFHMLAVRCGILYVIQSECKLFLHHSCVFVCVQ